MLELNGKHNKAKVYTDNIESEAISQIIELCNQEFTSGSKIRVMPDTHAGKGCTIGTTMTLVDKVVPNLVGVDIGCGMETVELKDKDIDCGLLDSVIREYIPSGFSVRSKEHKLVEKIDLKELKCYDKLVNTDRLLLSLGSLGGGNHFLEIDKDNEGKLYLVVHSGSRNLGKQVAELYQEMAYNKLIENREIKEDIINNLKRQGREKDIASELKNITGNKVPKHLAYLVGQDFDDYIHDMSIVQEFAMLSRKAMVDEIVNRVGLTVAEQFTTIHNYIEKDTMILRKGAISAKTGEKVLIPINMRDGSIIAIGKGNEDWNYSAPHGAGRLMSRSKAKKEVTMEEYKDSMEGIWSTSVNESTIDESPMAYKPMDEIIENIKDTVDIIKIIKPIYNYKAN